jgi:hypothetical protein
MAHYTITILALQKNNFDFGLRNYPIFDENYRNTLNSNILNYYLESEIGFETANLFKRILNDRMQLIMPKYNKMYNAQLKLLENDVFGNVDLREEFEKTNSIEKESTGSSVKTDTNNENKINNISKSGTSSENNIGSSSQTDTGTGTQTGSSTSNNKNLYQDTPQGSISMQTLDSTDVYATNFTIDNNTTSSTVSNNSSSSSSLENSTSMSGTTSATENNSTSISSNLSSNLSNTSSLDENGTENYIKKLAGNNGKKYKFELYDEYNKILENLINIDMLIINELQDLFMGIF